MYRPVNVPNSGFILKGEKGLKFGVSLPTLTPVLHEAAK